jgi:hypothetical protein
MKLSNSAVQTFLLLSRAALIVLLKSSSGKIEKWHNAFVAWCQVPPNIGDGGVVSHAAKH